MKSFFLLLFFSKWVLLTASPVTLSSEWVTLKQEEPLTAITAGAAVYVDVTKYVPAFDFESVNKKFPDGTIEGKLITASGEIVSVTNTASAHNNEAVHLILSSASSMPTDVKFESLQLRSNVDIESVDVYWKNFSK